MSAIRIINQHGEFITSLYSLDVAMDKLLPAEPADLRGFLTEKTHDDYSGIEQKSELLIMIAAMFPSAVAWTALDPK